jgi:hypothetical protein
LQEQISDGVNLLISILVRYPEIATVSFRKQNDSLEFTFMVSGLLPALEYDVSRKMLLDSIAAYHLLTNQAAEISEVELSSCEQVTMLTINRDVHTLSKGEITLLIALLRDKFMERLVIDSNDSLLEEDLLIQEELIADMLENIKNERTEHNLIGIREDGRVLVFNK